MRRSELCGRPDPPRPDHIEDLHQHQVDESQLFAEAGTPRLDLGDALYGNLGSQVPKTYLLTNRRRC